MTRIHTTMGRAEAGVSDGRRLGTQIGLCIVLAMSALLLVPTSVFAGSSAGNSAPGSALGTIDGPRSTNAATANLVDNGGEVLPASHTYVVWWGRQSAWAPDVKKGIGSLLSGFDGSSYLNTAAQYMRGAAISTTYEGAKVDPSPPTTTAYDSDLGAEISKEYGTSLDPDGIYIIFVSSFPGDQDFCGFHTDAAINGQSVPVAFILNTGHVSGCTAPNDFHVRGSKDLRSLANATAHEFLESVTDSQAGTATWAWIDSTGNEMADKCAWMFSDPVTLSNGSTWQLQMEWSNAVSGCVQTT